MRLIIDLHDSQTTAYQASGFAHFCFALTKAIITHANQCEIFVVLNANDQESVRYVRNSLRGLLPQQNIRVWYSLTKDQLQSKDKKNNNYLGSLNSHLRIAFLASLNPDVIQIMSLSTNIELSSFTSRKLLKKVALTSLILYDTPDNLWFYSTSKSRSIADIKNDIKHVNLWFTVSDELRHYYIKDFRLSSDRVFASAPIVNDNYAQLSVTILNNIKNLYDEYLNKQDNHKLPSVRKRRQHKLAFISPLPPIRSGIADYSASLLRVLVEYYKIDVIVDQKNISDKWIVKNCQVRSVGWFRKNAHSFDHILYQVGNNEYHSYMFNLIEQFPGVVVIHDFFLGDLLAYMVDKKQNQGVFYRYIYEAHGYKPFSNVEQIKNNDFWKIFTDTTKDYPANFSFIKNSVGLIFHNQYAINELKKFYNTDSLRYQKIPLIRDVAQKELRQEGKKHGGFIVSSFGLITPSKLSDRILQAWINSPLSKNNNCHLVFVGQLVESEYGVNFKKIVEETNKKNNNSNIKITGYLSDKEYKKYLSRSDVGIQLRHQSRGETSAALLDCLNYGLATILNAHASFAEIPKSIAHVMQDHFTIEELTNTLVDLYNNPSRKEQLSKNARQYMTTFHKPKKIAQQYFATMQNFYQDKINFDKDIFSSLSSIFPFSVSNKTLLNIAETFSVNNPDKRPRKKIFVDITIVVHDDYKTGIQRVVRSIVRALIENPPQGYQIEAVFWDGRQHYRYARKYLFDQLNMNDSCLTDEIIEYGAGDLFLGLDLIGSNLVASSRHLQKMRAMGVLVYMVVYDLLPIHFPHFFPENEPAYFAEWFNYVKKMDGAICISQSVALDVINQLDNDLLKVGWFHLGADIGKSFPTKGMPDNVDAIVEKLKKSPTFIMVGTVEPRKGHKQVLAAFESMWKNGQTSNLVIIGKQGWLMEEVCDLIKNHNQFDKKLFWFDSATDEFLECLYKLSSALIAASEGEGFGLPIIEAAQYGLTIIARDIPVFREVAGQGAYYFSGKRPQDLNKVIEKWLDDYEQKDVLSSGSIKPITWSESAKQIINLICNQSHANWLT